MIFQIILSKLAFPYSYIKHKVSSEAANFKRARNFCKIQNLFGIFGLLVLFCFYFWFGFLVEVTFSGSCFCFPTQFAGNLAYFGLFILDCCFPSTKELVLGFFSFSPFGACFLQQVLFYLSMNYFSCKKKYFKVFLEFLKAHFQKTFRDFSRTSKYFQDF